MKKTIFYLCLLLACVGCTTNPDNGSTQDGESKELTKEFKEYGFSITAPCELKNESAHAMGNSAYYLGTVNPNDSDDATGYQVVVKKMHKGAKDLKVFSEEELNNNMKQMEHVGFTNVEKVQFLDKYPGIVGDLNQNGSPLRAVIFQKDGNSIILTVQTKNELDQKFEKFTDSFKVIE
jgi:hypothetical protein